jgi:hypothetical protein
MCWPSVSQPPGPGVSYTGPWRQLYRAERGSAGIGHRIIAPGTYLTRLESHAHHHKQQLHTPPQEGVATPHQHDNCQYTHEEHDTSHPQRDHNTQAFQTTAGPNIQTPDTQLCAEQNSHTCQILVRGETPALATPGVIQRRLLYRQNTIPCERDLVTYNKTLYLRLYCICKAPPKYPEFKN